MKTRVQLQAEIAEAEKVLAKMRDQLRTLDNYPPGTVLRPMTTSSLAPFPFVIKLREVWDDVGFMNYRGNFSTLHHESNCPQWLVMWGDLSGGTYGTLSAALASHPDLSGELVEVLVP